MGWSVGCKEASMPLLGAQHPFPCVRNKYNIKRPDWRLVRQTVAGAIYRQQGLFGRVAFLQLGRACRNALELMMGDGAGGLANHKLRLDGDLRHVFAAPFN